MAQKKQSLLSYVCLAILFAIACGYQSYAARYSFPSYLGIQAVEWPFIPTYSHGKPLAEFVDHAVSGLKETTSSSL